MSTRGHRNFLEQIISWIFGGRIFRYRWVRWPIASLLTALAVHSIASGVAVEGQDKSVAIPALLFLLAIFLVVLPVLPLAEHWDDKDRTD